MKKNFKEAHQLKNTIWTRNDTEQIIESTPTDLSEDETISFNLTEAKNKTESFNVTSAYEIVGVNCSD